MQRGLTIVLGLAVVVLSVLLAIKSSPRAADAPSATTTVDAGGDAASSDASAGRGEDASMQALFGDDLTPAASAPAPDGGFRLADGTPVPALGAKAPKKVRFGVILVAYEGAQGASAHGPRSKHDALAMAEALAEDAKTDFKGAVQRGDNGSSDDMGTVPRGVLEGAPEAVLFALPPGGTSGVVDTPRGYWIVKRLE
jgi:hypothetical protein